MTIVFEHSKWIHIANEIALVQSGEVTIAYEGARYTGDKVIGDSGATVDVVMYLIVLIEDLIEHENHTCCCAYSTY